jgi:hypothetical protein
MDPKAIRSQFDEVFKEILRDPDSVFRQMLAGDQRVVQDLVGELIAFKTRVADHLWLTEMGWVIHVEVQATNDPDMPIRMAEYAVPVIRKHGHKILQIVLYVGNAALTMPDRIEAGGHVFSYKQIDMRDLPGDFLLRSGSVADALLSLLTRDGQENVGVVMRKLARLDAPELQRAAHILNNICQLRPKVSVKIKEELPNMPVMLSDMMENSPAMAQAWHAGRISAYRSTLLSQMNLKFGPLSWQISERVAAGTEPEISGWLERVLTAACVEEVFEEQK